MPTLVTKWFGSVLLEDGRVTQRRDFPRDARAIADRLLAVRNGDILDEERELATGDLVVTEPRLKTLGRLEPGQPLPAVDAAGADATLLHQASLLVARETARRAAGERDRYVVQAVRALDELQRTLNLLTERLREWYGLHYPEAVRHVEDAAKLAAFIAQGAARPDVAARVGIPHDASIGADLTIDELGEVQRFAQNLQALHEERARLEGLIEREVRTVAPTLAGVTGPLIAARLVAHANGLERLAYVSAGTVQTLGAENALFQHLREGKKPPKHGVLFQHPFINGTPAWARGRAARLLAGHASRAARLDFFSDAPTDRSESLRASLEQRIARVRTAPKPARAPPRRGFQRKGARQ